MSGKGKGTSRRAFLKTMAAAGAGSALATAGRAVDPAPALAADGQVPKRVFGRTGVKVSSLALGGALDMKASQVLMYQALKLGVNYWDTAETYTGGKSEEGIGQFLGRHPKVRKDIFLVTKSESRSPMMMSLAFKASLKNLKTDYVDLYFMHGVKRIKELDRPEIRKWAQEQKAGGRIKYFGFSAHSNMEDLLQHAATMDWIDGIMFTYNYRIMHYPGLVKAVEACHRAGIGLTAMKTQGGGPVKADSPEEIKLGGRFLKKGYTPFQAKLKAVWRDERIASICSHMPTTTLLMANAAAAMDRAKLTAGDLGSLRRHAAATCSEYCAGCAWICEGAVEGQAPIAEVMRSLMYLRSHGEADRARRNFARLKSAGGDRLLDHDYGEAMRLCPQGLDIAGLMRQAVRELA